MRMTHSQADGQADWIARAREVLPAGGLGNFDPAILLREGRGSRVRDENGIDYIDYLIGSGPMILGHGHREVVEAALRQISAGMTFFTGNTAAIELAEEICRAVACAERVRYVCSGGEAVMYALRLARAFTRRDRIVKFEGGYHGMSAEAQMSLAPGRAVNFPLALPDSAGIPESVRASMLIAPFNDADFFRSLAGEHGSEIAAVIVEPVQRIIPPEPGFLETLREECDRHGIVLIFDEIVTGFRVAYGGGQALYGVTPDVCTLGKIIGGGFALAAVAGRGDIMAHFDREKAGDGWLMQLGTLSGNPVAATAGVKTLEILRRPGAYESLERIGRRLMESLTGGLCDAGITHRIVGVPSVFDAVFTDGPVRNYRDMQMADAKQSARFNAALRKGGILKSPGKWYPSLAITDEDVSQTADAITAAVKNI